MKHIHSCPICASPLLRPDQKIIASRPRFNHDDGNVSFETAALVRYAMCLCCGAYIQTPRMTDEDILRFYANGYYRQWLGVEQGEMDADELRRARLDATIIKDTCGIVDSHLDVGASRGYLLQEVCAKFTAAVEPNHSYLKFSPNNWWEAADLVYGKYELVTAIHSLEHLIDPVAFLLLASSYVKDGGHLIVEVPSETSPGGWARLAHNFHFPPWTMHYMADRVGMKITHVMFTPHLFTIMERK